MAKYKIEHNVHECIGCAACAAVSKNWEMKEVNGEEKGMPKKTEFDEPELGTNKEAADSCPVEAIKIIDNKTKKQAK